MDPRLVYHVMLARFPEFVANCLNEAFVRSSPAAGLPMPPAPVDAPQAALSSVVQAQDTVPSPLYAQQLCLPKSALVKTGDKQWDGSTSTPFGTAMPHRAVELAQLIQPYYRALLEEPSATVQIMFANDAVYFRITTA